jgi:hypothetical protein
MHINPFMETLWRYEFNRYYQIGIGRQDNVQIVKDLEKMCLFMSQFQPMNFKLTKWTSY